MTRQLSVPVRCSECGKALRGVAGFRAGEFHVRRHVDIVTGKDCWGSRRSNHAPTAGGAA